MNTMSPGTFLERRSATTRFVTRIGPRRFVARIRSCCSSLISCSAPGAAVPALLTRTSTGPSAVVVAARNVLIDAGSQTSSTCAKAAPPASVMSVAVSSSWSTRLAPSATGQPSAPSACAIARPIPADAPVTTATRGTASANPLTAVDIERLARDDARPRRSEEHDGVGDVVLGRDQPERDAILDLAAHDVGRHVAARGVHLDESL